MTERSDYPSLLLRGIDARTSTTEVLLALDDAPDSAQAELLAGTIDAFGAVAALGGFAERASHVQASAWRSVGGASASATSMRFEFECAAIDHRAFQVLRNMLAQLRNDDIRVRAIVVSSAMLHLPDQLAAPVIDEINEDEWYPPLRDDAPLQFGDDEDALTELVRRCIVSLRAPVEQRHVDALRSIVDPWFDLIEAGGYAMPVNWPWLVHAYADTLTPFEECSIEISVLRYRASEQAWSVLGNLIAMNAHRLGLDLVGIVVDP